MATIAQPTLATTRPLYINRSEITSARRVLKLLQVVAGVICYSLTYVNQAKLFGVITTELAQQSGNNLYEIVTHMTSIGRVAIFLQQTSFCFWLVTFVMLITSFKTHSPGSLLRMTVFEPVYHILASVLYLCGGIGWMIVIGGLASRFPSLLAAGILGAVAGFLHGIHGYYSWKDWQAQKHQPTQIPQVVQSGQTSYIGAQTAPSLVVQSSYSTVQISDPSVQAPNQPQYKQ